MDRATHMHDSQDQKIVCFFGSRRHNLEQAFQKLKMRSIGQRFNHLSMVQYQGQAEMEVEAVETEGYYFFTSRITDCKRI